MAKKLKAQYVPMALGEENTNVCLCEKNKMKHEEGNLLSPKYYIGGSSLLKNVT